MKIVKWIVIVLVLLIVAAVVVLYASLNGIVKRTVETQGTEELHVATTLESVSLGLLKGTVDLSNFAVASPAGFSSPQMLSLGGLSVDTGGLMKLRDEPIHVSQIRIDQPKLVIEQSNLKLNFKELMDGLPSNPEQNPPATEKKPVKLIVDDLQINDATVVVKPGIPGLTQEIDLPIPSIDLKNIGNADGAQNGAAIKDVVTTVISQLAAKAADSDKLPPEVRALLSGNLNAIKDKLTSEAKDQLNKAATNLEKKVPGNLGGILNQATGQSAGTSDSSQQGGANTGKGLLDQGFGALRKAATQPK